ncbi:hypothetical protein [Lentibacillus sp. Marseille-P4043]|nr:hypothetical protein [Lentibacillus sp. Marseille-P4043]
MIKVEDRLLSTCLWSEEEELNHDELVRWAIQIINKQLEDKSFR